MDVEIALNLPIIRACCLLPNRPEPQHAHRPLIPSHNPRVKKPIMAPSYLTFAASAPNDEVDMAHFMQHGAEDESEWMIFFFFFFFFFSFFFFGASLP